ncbi:MAG: hypothetical protein KY432_07550 [Acidobacteria bacterium]|nr:hypothetical protein [Acidobacteriota bacterium]
MSRRILLICPEPLWHGRPAGVGIRFIEISAALSRAGFEVVLMSPDGAEARAASGRSLSPSAIAEESRRAEVAVVQGHAANDFFAHAERVPTVVDMYDPYLIENLSYAASDEGIWAHDWNTTMNSLRRGDFFLCSSTRQRAYYLGWLAALGRINPGSFADDPTLDSLLEVVPFGVPAPRAIPDKSLDLPSILFGGVYDWYDPILAIEAAALAAKEIHGLSLTFVSHPNAEVTPQSKFGQAKAFVDRNRLHDTIRFREWFSYEGRAGIYDDHVAAMLTFPRSLETELSFRTRVLDYLWGGLPVFTSPAAGTDEIIHRYQAGVVLGANAPEIASHMVSMLKDRATYRTLVEGTQRFVSDYQWSDLASPLVEFCRNPRIDENAERFVRLEATAQTRRPSLARRVVRKFRRTIDR